MPTRCNRGLYCRSYCLLYMFRAPLCTSSGVQEYYTVVAPCGISCCGFQVAGVVWSWGLCVRFAGCWFTRSKSHQICYISLPFIELNRYVTKPTNARQCIKVSYVTNIVASCMFRPLLWPSTRRCITNDGYVEILWRFMNQSRDIKQ